MKIEKETRVNRHCGDTLGLADASHECWLLRCSSNDDMAAWIHWQGLHLKSLENKDRKGSYIQ